MTESPDFVRNQDFFCTFSLDNLLTVFSDPNADPNGTGSGNHQMAQERIFPMVCAALSCASVVTWA